MLARLLASLDTIGTGRTHLSLWHCLFMLDPSLYRTLKGLKRKSYSLWCDLQWVEERFGDAFAEHYARFKQTIRQQFGDLRYKVTWERAWAHLWAKHVDEFNDLNLELIDTFTDATKEGWEHLLPLVLDEFLQLPNKLACLKDGFERIVQLHPADALPQAKTLFYAVQAALQRLDARRGHQLPAAA